MAWAARIAVAAIAFAVAIGDASADKQADARRTFEAAQASFKARDFTEALRQYQEVYDAIKAPALHFNIAQCHRSLGQWAEAAARFRHYLREAGKPDNARSVEDTVRQLDRLIEAVEHLRQGRHRKALEIYLSIRDDLQKREDAGLPVLERDIGRARERLGEYDEARAAYQKYLEELPLAPDHDEIEKAIERLDRELDPDIAGPPPPGTDTRKPIYKKWWFWGGVAAVVVVGSVTAIALAGGPPDTALGNVGFDR